LLGRCKSLGLNRQQGYRAYINVFTVMFRIKCECYPLRQSKLNTKQALDISFIQIVQFA